MTSSSDTPKPADDQSEADPKPQENQKPVVPEEDDPKVEETEEQPT